MYLGVACQAVRNKAHMLYLKIKIRRGLSSQMYNCIQQRIPAEAISGCAVSQLGNDPPTCLQGNDRLYIRQILYQIVYCVLTTVNNASHHMLYTHYIQALYTYQMVMCVGLQWALHHLCHGALGLQHLLPRLDCSPVVDCCHTLLLQGMVPCLFCCVSTVSATGSKQ